VIPPIASAIGPLGPAEWTVGPIAGVGSDPAAAAAATDATGAAGGGFGGALSSAIGALEQTQNNATGAAQALATGQLSDPTQAVSAIENASLSMQLASQVRNKLDEAATTIFQTQV
jgi:flagellar hook-basal body complex protein FliE